MLFTKASNYLFFIDDLWSPTFKQIWGTLVYYQVTFMTKTKEMNVLSRRKSMWEGLGQKSLMCLKKLRVQEDWRSGLGRREVGWQKTRWGRKAGTRTCRALWSMKYIKKRRPYPNSRGRLPKSVTSRRGTRSGISHHGSERPPLWQPVLSPP